MAAMRVRQMLEDQNEVNGLIELAVQRMEANWEKYGDSGWNEHGEPEMLPIDIREELADAIVYQVMFERDQARKDFDVRR